MKTIRIFISSPGDVAVERDKARKVIESLKSRYLGKLNLESVLWEDLPLGAVDSFQAGIDVVLSGKPVDIAVFILWSRIGSPPGGPLRKPDGSEYRSGTEREFELMLAARAQSEDHRPEILVYVRADDRTFKVTMLEKATTEIEEMLRQHKLAKQFIQEHFQDQETKCNLRAYHSFSEPNTFAERLRTHLRHLLDGIVMDGALGFGSWEGNPYRGLDVFHAEHSPIFFGRDEEVCEALERLRDQAQAGCGFLLVVGASGAGKSSLARAGILPALEHENPDNSVDHWRTAVLAPGECGESLCRGLARTLLEGLPELKGDDGSLVDLEEALREGKSKALTLLLKRACGGTVAGGRIRLVLLVDQLEELFTHSSFSEAEAATFLAALQTLAVSGCVWVLATVRSDFYDHCQQFPVLMAMKEPRGQLDLLSPDRSDIHRIITGPALLAGVTFEKTETGESLDKRILDDAVGHPEALPLIEFALAQLFEARTDEGRLTYAAYERLGGLEGAIGRHAEAVFLAQPQAVRAASGSVFQALVAIDDHDEARPVRRRVAMNGLADTPEQCQLVDALLAARLLRSDRGEVSVVHEALLRRWGRAVLWIEANRERLRVRDRIAARMAETAPLSENDPLTSSAKHYLAENPETFEPAQRDYVRNQLDQLAHERKRRSRIRRAVIAGLSLLTLFSLFGAAIALRQWRLADKATYRAKVETERAITRTLISESHRLRAEGKPVEAYALLRASARPEAGDDGLRESIRGGLDELAFESLSMVLKGHSDCVMDAVISPDGKLLATASDDKTARIWLVESGLTKHIFNHSEDVTMVAFSPDGQKLATGSNDTLFMWDLNTGKILYSLKLEVHAVNITRNSTFSFSQNGKMFATREKTTKIWDTDSGHLIQSLKNSQSVLSFSFFSDGKMISIAEENQVSIWDIESGRITRKIDCGMKCEIIFSLDGKKIATHINESIVHIYDTDSADALVQLEGHDKVSDFIFFPDGKSIYTLDNNSARIWDTSSGELIHILKGRLENPSFSFPDGKMYATTEEKIVRIWDTKSGTLLKIFNTIHDGIHTISFSYDGKRLITASKENDVTIWNLEPNRFLKAFDDKWSDRIRRLSFSQDGKRIALNLSEEVVVLNADKGAIIHNFERNKLKHSSISADGKRIAALSDNTPGIWSVDSGKLIQSYIGHAGPTHDITFSPDGTRIATASSDLTAKIWNADSGVLSRTLTGHAAPVEKVIFSPDGKRIATTSSDLTIKIWNADSGELLRTFTGFAVEFIVVAFHPNGKQVAIASPKQNYSNSNIQIWDVDSGEQIKSIIKPGAVRSISFNIDGRKLAVSIDAGNIIVDILSGRQLQIIRNESSPTFSISSFTPDGNRLFVANNGRITIWDATFQPTPDLIRWTGARTNLRVCRDSYKVVPVLPYPSPESVWAPEEFCREEQSPTSREN